MSEKGNFVDAGDAPTLLHRCGEESRLRQQSVATHIVRLANLPEALEHQLDLPLHSVPREVSVLSLENCKQLRVRSGNYAAGVGEEGGNQLRHHLRILQAALLLVSIRAGHEVVGAEGEERVVSVGFRVKPLLDLLARPRPRRAERLQLLVRNIHRSVQVLSGLVARVVMTAVMARVGILGRKLLHNSVSVSLELVKVLFALRPHMLSHVVRQQ